MVDAENGGYYGRIDGKGIVYPSADKGSVLNARILWTFSSAFRIYHKPEFLLCATRAKDYILDHFQDKKHDGVYWLLDNKGNRLDTKKQIYAQAFTLYALAEYYRATGDEIALKQAIIFYKIIEKHSFDEKLGGYFEAFSREWGEIGDLRLSTKDANEKKTMNTHLHVLEAYTNLYRVWKDDGLKRQLQALIEIFADKIVNSQTYHLNMFFTENWEDKTDLVSYGHDIESSWLLYEAAEVLGDHELASKIKGICIMITKAACEGLQSDGSLIYERFFENNHLDTDRHWWVQAEAVVGLFNTWQLTGDKSYQEKSVNAWNFIKNHIVDKSQGEWLWSVDAQMQPNREGDKAGFWKCPYHNARMCFEIIERIKE
jgi:mannobiose 2-epimerase